MNLTEGQQKACMVIGFSLIGFAEPIANFLLEVF